MTCNGFLRPLIHRASFTPVKRAELLNLMVICILGSSAWDMLHKLEQGAIRKQHWYAGHTIRWNYGAGVDFLQFWNLLSFESANFGELHRRLLGRVDVRCYFARFIPLHWTWQTFVWLLLWYSFRNGNATLQRCQMDVFPEPWPDSGPGWHVDLDNWDFPDLGKLQPSRPLLHWICRY